MKSRHKLTLNFGSLDSSYSDQSILLNPYRNAPLWRCAQGGTENEEINFQFL